MSQRSTFTSEYIYCEQDYKAIRAEAERWGNHKLLCFSPPCKWDDNEMPIIQGKIGEYSEYHEIYVLEDFLRAVRIKYPVTFILLLEGDGYFLLTKCPDGTIIRKKLIVSEEKRAD